MIREMQLLGSVPGLLWFSSVSDFGLVQFPVFLGALVRFSSVSVFSKKVWFSSVYRNQTKPPRPTWDHVKRNAGQMDWRGLGWRFILVEI